MSAGEEQTDPQVPRHASSNDTSSRGASDPAAAESRRSLELACIELARHARWEDLARLCPRPYDPDEHGLAIGYHLARACVETGNLDVAEEVVVSLQMRPDPFGRGALDRLIARVAGARERQRAADLRAAFLSNGNGDSGHRTNGTRTNGSHSNGNGNGQTDALPGAPTPEDEVSALLDGPTDAEPGALPRFELDPFSGPATDSDPFAGFEPEEEGAAALAAAAESVEDKQPPTEGAGAPGSGDAQRSPEFSSAPTSPPPSAQKIEADELIVRAAGGSSRRKSVVVAEEAVAWWLARELKRAGHAVTCERAPRRSDRYLECSWKGPWPPRLVLDLWDRDDGASGRQLLWSSWRLSLRVPLGAAARLVKGLEQRLRAGD